MTEELIKETRLTCQEYLPRLIQATSGIVYDIQSGNEAGAMSILPNVIDGLQWLVEAVQGIQQNGCNLSITIASLTKHFEELERALEVRDYVLTADLFEYEITPTLEEWLKKVKLTEQ